MSRRQSCRSASEPKYIENSRNGTQWLITSKPTSAGAWNFCHNTQYVMTCSTLSAIIDSAAPNRYGRQSRLRNAANFSGGVVTADDGGASTVAVASGSTMTWVAMPQAAHMLLG